MWCLTFRMKHYLITAHTDSVYTPIKHTYIYKVVNVTMQTHTYARVQHVARKQQLTRGK